MMVLRIRRLEFEDNRTIIHSIRDCPAKEGLAKAMNYVEQKEGSSGFFKRACEFLAEEFDVFEDFLKTEVLKEKKKNGKI